MVASEGEGVLVHPLPFNEESVLDSAKNLLIQVNVLILSVQQKKIRVQNLGVIVCIWFSPGIWQNNND